MDNLIKIFKVRGRFFSRYEKLIRETVIPYQEKALKDEIEGAEKSHCIQNFILAAEKLKTGECTSEFYGMVFQDSDAAKWLEGAAYILVLYPDEELERRCDEMIGIIGEAQHEDGYLNTYFTVKEPDKRWTNLEEAHELYCAGHMIEAAVAYADCTGKTELLSIMCGMADHIYEHFITNGAPGYPGHPEIELALMRLYRFTGKNKYLELAKHFIDVRGADSDFFIKESERYKWTVWGNNHHDREYTQCHKPVREQTEASGHAVRAVYLYTGMADLAAEIKDVSLEKACKTLWENITRKQMYITGGIGSSYEGEAFTRDYHLPNDTAYAETCASIGLVFFARKMLALEKNSEYADVMERALYNTVLAGMQLDGQRFFYVNPLESLPGISGRAKTHHHALTERPKWFACACCPPNAARLISSVAEYAWIADESARTVYSNLFIGGELDLTASFGCRIIVTTDFPFDGKVVYKIISDNGNTDMTLAVRLPSWSVSSDICLNGKKPDYTVVKGYAYINGGFSSGDEITVVHDMTVKCVYCNEKVSDNSSKVAFTRGPLVYCAEGADNGGDVLSLKVKDGGNIEVSGYNAGKLEGIAEISVEGFRLNGSESLYSYEKPSQTECRINLVPYYSWANRGENQMRVWLPV